MSLEENSKATKQESITPQSDTTSSSVKKQKKPQKLEIEDCSNPSEKVVDLIIDYVPHTFQKVIHECKAKYRVVVAGRRFGKTTIAIMECLQVALSKAYARVWYIAPSYRQAETVAWKLLLRTIPPELIRRQNNMKLEVELFNGAIIELKGTENEDSLRGVGLDFAVLDEYAFMKPHIWGMIIQPMFATTGGRAMFIGTPAGKNHFHELFLEGQQEGAQYKSFHYKSTDSEFVDKEFIEGERKRLPDNIFRQEYEGNFEDFTGLIYPEFNHAFHVIEPMHVPVYWRRIHAIDPSISTGITACIFTAIDEDGNIVIYDEYYEENLPASTHAKEILTKYDPNNDVMLIDPHAANKTIQREGQFFAPIDEYIACGVTPILGESHVDAGINRVREFLKVDPDKIHPYKVNLKGSPKIFVFNNCHKFIWEMERYRWADRPESKMGMLKPVPYKKWDHQMDCLRYVLTSRITGETPRFEENINKRGPWAEIYGLNKKKENGIIYGRKTR